MFDLGLYRFLNGDRIQRFPTSKAMIEAVLCAILLLIGAFAAIMLCLCADATTYIKSRGMFNLNNALLVQYMRNVESLWNFHTN